jgi:hypothetical protein
MILTHCVSYVHGIMDGEIVMDWSEGKAAAVDFEIQ